MPATSEKSSAPSQPLVVPLLSGFLFLLSSSRAVLLLSKKNIKFASKLYVDFDAAASLPTTSIESSMRIGCGSEADHIRINPDRNRINCGSKPNRNRIIRESDADRCIAGYQLPFGAPPVLILGSSSIKECK